MKRLLCLLLLFSLCCSCLSPAALAEEEETAFSYDFDFFFRLNPEAFPARSRSRAQGYADLLSMLEVRGNWTYAPAYDCFDTQVEIIPVSKPSASLSFRLFGYPSHVLLTSPLLGSQTVLFNSEALMEFSLKTYHHLGIPLPYLALLFPYTTYNAFYYSVEAWNREIGPVTRDTTVKYSWVTALTEALRKLLEQDNALQGWFEAISLQSDSSETLQAQLQAVPDYIETKLAGKKNISVTVRDGVSEWSNRQGVFFRKTDTDKLYALETAFPVTDAGFQPAFHYSVKKLDQAMQTSLKLEYASTEETLRDLWVASDPETLLSLSAEVLLPTEWPIAGSWPASVQLEGSLLPSAHFSLTGISDEEGRITISVHDSTETDSPEIFQLYGTLLSVEPETVPWFDKNWMIEFLNIFSVNDVTLQEFVQQIARPAILGLLDFLVEVPAASCQSVMDDLSDSGVLRLILGV